MSLLNRSIIWNWFQWFVIFLPFITSVNEFAVQPACDPYNPKKVSPVLGSKSLLRWTLLLGVPPGGKMAGEPCQRSEVDIMILMFRKMHCKRLQMYVFAFPTTEVLNVKFESWIPRYFLFELPCGMFSDTHRMNRSYCHSNTQVASWLDLMISHSNRCLPGIFQVWPFWCLVSVIDELYTLFQLILLSSHLSKEWGSNKIFQPCLFWTHYSPCKGTLTSSGQKETTAVISDTVDSCWKSCTTPGFPKSFHINPLIVMDGLNQAITPIPWGIPDDQ